MLNSRNSCFSHQAFEMGSDFGFLRHPVRLLSSHIKRLEAIGFRPSRPQKNLSFFHFYPFLVESVTETKKGARTIFRQTKIRSKSGQSGLPDGLFAKRKSQILVCGRPWNGKFWYT
jgi:hypothetical protein